MESKYYKEYYINERTHWWFLGRLEIIRMILFKTLKKQTNLKILNIGVATGGTIPMLTEFGDVTNVEYDQDCCSFLNLELGLEVINASVTDLPFNNDSFDVICAFDVIEHIEDDSKALSEVKRVLKENGKIIITVPMFMSLWSEHDLINHHFRRYSKNEMYNKLSSQGLRIEYFNFFNFILFIPIYLVRVISNLIKFKKKKDNLKSDFNGLNSNTSINKFLLKLLLLEKKLISMNIQLPFGVSSIFIIHK